MNARTHRFPAARRARSRALLALSLGIGAAWLIAAGAQAGEIVPSRVEALSVRHEAPWLSIRYRMRNETGRRIGSGELRCTALDADGAEIGFGASPISDAAEPEGVQTGLLLIAVDQRLPVRHRCQVEVSHWLVDGRWVRATALPAAPATPPAPGRGTLPATGAPASTPPS